MEKRAHRVLIHPLHSKCGVYFLRAVGLNSAQKRKKDVGKKRKVFREVKQ